MLIVPISMRTMVAKTPKAILDHIVKTDMVQDVMLLRKAAAAFTSLTVKGYLANRFSVVIRLKADMTKPDGIPEECKGDVTAAMDIWENAVMNFEAHAAKEEDWTVEAGVSLTNLMFSLAAELDAAHTGLSQAWAQVKKARKVAAAASVKQDNAMAKAHNEAVRPFIQNGMDGGWKAILLHLKLVTTGHVHAADYECPGYEASQAAAMETATDLDWSKPHYWHGQQELPATKQGHRK